MTISSSLNAGVAGLAANAARLATISDNIVNSSAYGYKRAEADFSSMVIDSGGGGYYAGGVRVTTQRLIYEREPLVSSNNSTDLAVRGRGFLPVTSEVSLSAATDFSLRDTLAREKIGSTPVESYGQITEVQTGASGSLLIMADGSKILAADVTAVRAPAVNK